ncbi:MAG: hypothetical protein R3F60_26720 [bacterium]
MALMEPTYLQERTSTNDDLRRLLYTAGVAVVAAHGGVEKEGRDGRPRHAHGR